MSRQLNNKSTMQPLKFNGSFVLMKELQRTVAFYTYDSCLLSVGKSMHSNEMKNVMEEKYFVRRLPDGTIDPTSIGFAKQFLLGKQDFVGLFETEIVQSEGEKKFVREIFTGRNQKIYVGDNKGDLNIAVMHSTNCSDKRTNIAGRTLIDQATKVVREGKKMLAIVS
jgi:hypothetical protein